MAKVAIKWEMQYFPLVRLFFNQKNIRKTKNMYLKILKYNLNNIQYTDLGIFTQWNVLNTNICHMNKKTDVLGSD